MKFVPLGVFAAGLALTAGFYAIVTDESLRGSLVHRYFCGHPIEQWTAWLFFWGMAALAWKAWRVIAERRAVGRPLLPASGGRASKASDVAEMLQTLDEAPAGVRGSRLERRLRDGLDYVHERGSAHGLEERLQLLADRDADDLDGSYELITTITWAIPILGFLGTVVGITIAIANISPEQLQESLSDVVAGLAVAFDTTALALALSMVVVLGRFMVERAERALLARVDQAAEDALLHRFAKHDAPTQAAIDAVEGVADAVLRSTRDAWREQGQLWTAAVARVGESQVQALALAAEQVIAKLGDAAAQLAACQAEAKRQSEQLARLVGEANQLGQLERALDQNLASLANVHALDETIHSLAAAAHLLTARVARPVSGPRVATVRPAEAAA